MMSVELILRSRYLTLEKVHNFLGVVAVFNFFVILRILQICTRKQDMLKSDFLKHLSHGLCVDLL